MKLNLEFYEKQNNNENVLNDESEQLEENIYGKKIDNKSTKSIRHLTNISENILNWYPFKEDCSILEFGGNLGAITGLLCKKAKKVVTVENKKNKAELIAKRYKNINNLEIIVGEFNKIKIEDKYDYIILIGCLPYIAKANGKKSEEILQELQNYLKEDGKIIIGVDNRFGIKYFVGNPDPYLNKKFVNLLNYNNEENKIETYTKEKLTNILEKAGYKYQNFYYPLPDYRMPNVIFSDNELPRYNTIDKYVPYFSEKSDILINEIDLFREILKSKEELFTFFTNAYLVEASKVNTENHYKYISYNNMRKNQYRLITKIGKQYVEKELVDEKAREHYNNIKGNISKLKDKQIKMLDTIENEKIISKYISQEYMLSNILLKKLEDDKLEEFYNIIDKFYENIKQSSSEIKNIDNTIFEEKNISIDKDKKEKLHFLEDGFWDMTFKNCFYIENDFYFFDQEWKEINMPAEYILYRSIVYTISLRRYINIDRIIEKYNLNQFINEFKQLDEKLQEEIRDDDIWKFYSENHNFNIDSVKQELQEMKKADKIKNETIEDMRKRINDLQDQKVTMFIKGKVKKIIRRKK